MSEPVVIGIVGAGYWGQKLVRNAMALPAVQLRWVCDRDLERGFRVVGDQTPVRVTPHLEDMLSDAAVEAVAIATPPGTHADVAMQCLEAGRHVLVEKPLADSYEAGARLVEAAAQRGLVLHCDHTFCYTAAVRAIRDLVAEGRLVS